MHTELEAFAELLIELFVVVLLLRNLGKHFKALLDKVLLDHSQNLVLLESLTRDVQRKILRVHNTLDKVEPLWHELIAVIHDEYTAHVQLDIVSLLLGFEKIKWRPAWHEQ